MQAKPYICDLTPYQPSTPLEHISRTYGHDPDNIIQMASNENPFGCSPYVTQTLQQVWRATYRYPDQHELLQALAVFYDVATDQVAIGNGSNDILDVIARTYLGAGDEAISSEHSFAVYRIATRTCGARNIVVPTKHYTIDLAAVQQAITIRTKVVWLDNPGNPTGTFIPYKKLKQFLRRVPERIIVVLDEAYYEYLDASMQENAILWLQQFPNLVIVRTFSKIYGLAGLRIGYSIANESITALLHRVRHPFNVNVPALVAAQAALKDQAFVRQSKQKNTVGREQLTAAAMSLGLKTIPAYGNFVSVEVPKSAAMYEALLQQGISTRPLANYGMPAHLRVSVGTEKQNESFVSALAKAVESV